MGFDEAFEKAEKNVPHSKCPTPIFGSFSLKPRRSRSFVAEAEQRNERCVGVALAAARRFVDEICDTCEAMTICGPCGIYCARTVLHTKIILWYRQIFDELSLLCTNSYQTRSHGQGMRRKCPQEFLPEPYQIDNPGNPFGSNPDFDECPSARA